MFRIAHALWHSNTAYLSLNRHLLATAYIFLFLASSVKAQIPDQLKSEFADWAARSSHRIDTASLSGPHKDLQPIRKMIGDARIVALSESLHGASEPLIFRNRLFRYLVEDLDFAAIALESGIVESRVLNDYVIEGTGEFESVMRKGFSAGFDMFQQNRELIQWMREYNSKLSNNATKIKIFGFDVPGSGGNLYVASTPETSLLSALEFLKKVDPEAAVPLHNRVEKYLPILKGTDGYGLLPIKERDQLTAAISNLIALIEQRRFSYINQSSKDQYEWASRAAVGARQIDTWFRLMPEDWTPSGSYEWTTQGIQVRDRAMADNLQWILSRLEPSDRILAFASVTHVGTTLMQFPDRPYQLESFGSYAKALYGSDFVNILNIVNGGEIAMCASDPSRNRSMQLRAPPADSIVDLFAAIDVPQYFLDLRLAPTEVSEWLMQPKEHWNGFGGWGFPTSAAFDIAYYTSPVSPDCASI
jgi:erythromycin esterase